MKCAGQEKKFSGRPWIFHLQINEKTHEKFEGIQKFKDWYLFSSPIPPISWISNCSPADVTWYYGDNSGRASVTIGLGWRCLFCRCDLIIIPKWPSYAKLTAIAWGTFSGISGNFSGVILGGNCPTGSYPGGEFSGWALSRWVLT